MARISISRETLSAVRASLSDAADVRVQEPQAPQTVDWDAIRADEERRRLAWEAETRHGRWTIAELRAAFDRVADPSNWKNPIRTMIADGDREIVEAAISFFAGSPATFTPFVDGCSFVEAPGYYASVGA